MARLAISSVIAFSTASIFNSLLVVVKESNEAVEDWLKNVFAHHWIGHGVLTLIVFALALLISMPLTKTELTDKSAKVLAVIVPIIAIISFLIIFGFYLSHL